MRTGEPNIANDEGNFMLLQDNNVHTNRAYKFELHNSKVSLKHAKVFVVILLISSAFIKYI